MCTSSLCACPPLARVRASHGLAQPTAGAPRPERVDLGWPRALRRSGSGRRLPAMPKAKAP
eukprot:5526030-Lingulodinium_polyedra.AAC.1